MMDAHFSPRATFCLSSAACCSFCFLMTFDLKKRIMDWSVLFLNNFFYLASPQRRYRRWAISLWWCEAYWSRISWVKVICLLLLVYSYIIRFPSQYYESMSTHFALNYLSFKYYVKLILCYLRLVGIHNFSKSICVLDVEPLWCYITMCD